MRKYTEIVQFKNGRTGTVHVTIENDPSQEALDNFYRQYFSKLLRKLEIREKYGY
ncbi:hypothetical protein Ga0466249_004520 [Sporomusaceae bacterium BoRhaA]|nr:hypothetical protein [Pelorhabdus rhamnosifermentans]